MSFAKKVATSAVGAALMLTVACSSHEPAAKAEKKSAPVAASTVAAQTGAVPDLIEASGTVKARVTATLSSRMMAQVREVRVQTGDTVQAGQTLVVLDARDVETAERQAQQVRAEAGNAVPEADSAIAAAQAQLTLAQATFNRMKDLLDKKSITAQEFDEVQAKLRLAEANVAMARARKSQIEARIRQAEEGVAQAAVMKSHTTLTAPFAGVVIEKKVEPGVLAAPGVPLLVIEQAGGYRLEAAVEEARLSQIKRGMRAEILLDAAGAPMQSHVEEIVPSIDPMSRTFTVKIPLPANPANRSGLFGRARFRTGERDALLIPASAVREQGQMRTVFVVDAGVAHARLVTVGARFDNNVEVLSGLQAGEKVVAPLPAGIADGVEVRQ